MKQFLIWCLLFFSTLQAKAQVWEKHYALPSDYLNLSAGSFVFKAGIGGGVFFYHNNNATNPSAFKNYYQAFAVNGDSVWSKRISFDSIASVFISLDFAISQNGKHHFFNGLRNLNIGTINQCKYLRYSPGGSLLKSWKINNYGRVLNASISVASGNSVYQAYDEEYTDMGFGLVADTNHITDVLERRDTNGVVLWSKVFIKDSVFQIGQNSPLPFSWGYCFAGPNEEVYYFRKNSHIAGSPSILHRYDVNGLLTYSVNLTPLLCTPPISAYIENVLPQADSSVFVGLSDDTQNFIVLHLDKYGQMLDTLTLKQGYQNNYYNGILQKSNGNLVLRCINYSTGIIYSGLREFDKNFNPLAYTPQVFDPQWSMDALSYGNSSKGVVTGYAYGPIFKLISTDSLFNSYPNSIKGSVVMDLNKNCSQDNGDAVNGEKLITCSDGASRSWYGYANAAGMYTVQVPPGTYTVSHESGWYRAALCPANPSSISVGPTPLSIPLSLFDTLVPNVTDVKVQLAVDPYFFGSQGSVFIWYENLGTAPAAGTIQLTKDAATSYSFSNVSPSQISGDTLYFNFNNLAPGSGTYISLSVPANPGVSTGAPLRFRAEVLTQVQDVAPANNKDSVVHNFFGQFRSSAPASVLPSNYMSVNRPTTVNGDETFLYKIRFRNTTGYTCKEMWIFDSLSPYFDFSSFKLLGSSHSYEMKLNPAGRLQFQFKNINLPDSAQSLVNSEGWLLYAIRAKASWPLGQSIKNMAAIHYDMHTPVLTNSRLNKRTYNPTPVSKQESKKEQITVFPNPADSYMNLNYSSEFVSCSLYSMEGLKLWDFTLSGNGQDKINLEGYEPGLYFLKFKGSSKAVAKKLLITH